MGVGYTGEQAHKSTRQCIRRSGGRRNFGGNRFSNGIDEILGTESRGAHVVVGYPHACVRPDQAVMWHPDIDPRPRPQARREWFLSSVCARCRFEPRSIAPVIGTIDPFPRDLVGLRTKRPGQRMYSYLRKESVSGTLLSRSGSTGTVVQCVTSAGGIVNFDRDRPLPISQAGAQAMEGSYRWQEFGCIRLRGLDRAQRHSRVFYCGAIVNCTVLGKFSRDREESPSAIELRVDGKAPNRKDRHVRRSTFNPGGNAAGEANRVV